MSPDSRKEIDYSRYLNAKIPTSEQDLPIVTVVTVVVNDAEGLRKTILSTANQDYRQIRHIIIDGGSTDGTLSVIQEHESVIDFWISEPDRGIYDAMNKGIAQATGQWLFFLNAGDVFYDDNAVETAMAKASSVKEHLTVMYGKVILSHENGRAIVKRPKPVLWIYYGLFASHQSMFFRRETLVAGYSLDYPLAGDYALIAKLYLQGARFVQLNHIISVFEEGGFSYKNASQGRDENHRIRVNVLGMPSFLSKLIYVANRLTWNLQTILRKPVHRV